MLKTQRHTQQEYFPTPPGTCFIKPSMIRPGQHLTAETPNYNPFVVINENETDVECLMIRPLYDEKKHIDRRAAVQHMDSAIEIDNPHPPMDPSDTRRVYTDAKQVFVIPKAALYGDTFVEICNNGGIKLNDQDVQSLRTSAYECANDPYAQIIDPYDCANRDYPIDQFMTGRKSKRALPSVPAFEQDGNQLSM